MGLVFIVTWFIFVLSFCSSPQVTCICDFCQMASMALSGASTTACACVCFDLSQFINFNYSNPFFIYKSTSNSILTHFMVLLLFWRDLIRENNQLSKHVLKRCPRKQMGRKICTYLRSWDSVTNRLAKEKHTNLFNKFHIIREAS